MALRELGGCQKHRVNAYFYICCTKVRHTALIGNLENGQKSGKSRGIL